MPVPTHLLERAYQLINANQLQNAELVLDAVVRVDPQNIDAWKTYLQIHQNQTDLDWLKERVLRTNELSETCKTELVNYHHYLTHRLSGTEEVNIWADKFDSVPEKETQETVTPEDEIITFELLDMFDYPIKNIRNEPRIRPRRRAMYNPFTVETANNVLKAISRHPLGMKAADYLQKTITLVNDLNTNPQETYARFSRSPYFEKSIGTTLLTLFILGVRLAMSGYFLGYLFLVMFVIGSGWWLANFGNLNTGQNRIYLHENKINLPEIVVVEIDQEQEQESLEEDSKQEKVND